MKNQNPFIEKYIEKNKRHFVQKKTTHLQDSEFLKVYIEANDVLSSLQNCSKVLFQFVFKILQRTEAYNTTMIDISHRHYKMFCANNNIKPMVKSSFYRSRAELIEKEIIAETIDTGIFYFNLNFFFNGDRVYVIQEYIRKSDIEKNSVEKETKVVKEVRAIQEQDQVANNVVREITEEEYKAYEAKKFAEYEAKRKESKPVKKMAFSA